MPNEMVKYGSYELDAADEEEKDLARRGNYMKLKVGRNIVRILPPPPSRKSPFVKVRRHEMNTAAGDFVPFACPRSMAKKRCPVCAKADKMKASSNPLDQKKAKDLYPRTKTFANVIDRDDPEAGVKIFVFGIGIHEDLVNIRKDEDMGGDFTHPTQGFDIGIKRTGTGMNDTKYKVLSGKQSPLSPDAKQMNEWIADQPDLLEHTKIPSEEQIIEMLTGQASEQEPETKSAGSDPDVFDQAFEAQQKADGEDDFPENF